MKPTLDISRNHVGLGYQHNPDGSHCWHMLVELRWRDIVNGGYFPRINLNRHEWSCNR